MVGARGLRAGMDAEARRRGGRLGRGPYRRDDGGSEGRFALSGLRRQRSRRVRG